MRVDVLATQPHYADHILPVFDALPAEIRGRIIDSPPRDVADITLVAGNSDARLMQPHAVVWIEHGVGQSFVGNGMEKHSSYPGGRHPRHIIGYVCPSQRVADAWSHNQTVVAGCPKLDRWFPNPPAPEPRTLSITWHWDVQELGLCPELRSARPHYDDGMFELLRRWESEGWTILGTGHPRARVELGHYWRRLGIEPTWDSNEVLERSALVIGDQLSLLYEAAALDRAVLCLNAPWYRRDVEHGLRFWGHMPGGDLDNMRQLAELDIARYVDEDWSMQRRIEANVYTYAYLDGRASQRAADFIVNLLRDERRKGVRWDGRA